MSSVTNQPPVPCKALTALGQPPTRAKEGPPLRRLPWGPCEQFVRQRLGMLSPLLTPLAQTADYCADYVSDSGIFWTVRKKAMGPGGRLGTYEEILQPWFMGRTRQERMSGLRAFCGGTVYASWGERAPPLTDDNLIRSLVDPEFKKYFGGNQGFAASDVNLIRLSFEQRIMRPCALLHFRQFIDSVIGRHSNLTAAQAAVKRLLPRAHPDHYENLLRDEAQMARNIARKIYDALLLVRELLKDPDYGAALYEPRRLERSQGIGWKMGIAVGATVGSFFLRPGQCAPPLSSRST